MGARVKVTVDRAGRVVIPKSIRDRNQLSPGTEVEVVEVGDRIELILPDDREPAVLVEKDGRLVISGDTGDPISMAETLALRDALREPRDP